jgi:hypothetical protein
MEFQSIGSIAEDLALLQYQLLGPEAITQFSIEDFFSPRFPRQTNTTNTMLTAQSKAQVIQTVPSLPSDVWELIINYLRDFNSVKTLMGVSRSIYFPAQIALYR